MRKQHPLAWQGPPTDFATNHCMQCKAGWTRTGQGANVVVCLLDREPVFTNMTSCDHFEPRKKPMTGSSHDPSSADVKALYADLSDRASFAFTATVDGRIYARHGTTIDTRLTVIDRSPCKTDAVLVPAGHAASLAELLSLIETKLPSRPPLSSFPAFPKAAARPAAVTAAQPRGQARSPSSLLAIFA